MPYDTRTDECMRMLIYAFHNVWSIRTAKPRFFVRQSIPPQFGFRLAETYDMMPALYRLVRSTTPAGIEAKEKQKISVMKKDRIRQIRELEHKALRVWRYHSQRRKHKPNPAWVVLFIFCSLKHIPFPGELVPALSSSVLNIEPDRSMRRSLQNKRLQRVQQATSDLQKLLRKLCGLTTM